MICLAKSIGGGFWPLGAFGASRAVMDLISQHKVFHGGTYIPPRVMAAGLATFREVPHARERGSSIIPRKISPKAIAPSSRNRLQAHVASAGVKWRVDA